MGIRNYEITVPASSGELRAHVADRISRSAVAEVIHVDVREIGVDIPAADSPAGFDFRLLNAQLREGSTRIQGETTEGATVNVLLAEQDEPATMSVVTAE